MRLFERTLFYSQAIEAQTYLHTEEAQIKGWLNLVVIKEFLTVRAEIDLNYIDLHPSNVGIFGWKLEEPIIIILDVSEIKVLNTCEEELSKMGFVEMWKLGMITFLVSLSLFISFNAIECECRIIR